MKFIGGGGGGFGVGVENADEFYLGHLAVETAVEPAHSAATDHGDGQWAEGGDLGIEFGFGVTHVGDPLQRECVLRSAICSTPFSFLISSVLAGVAAVHEFDEGFDSWGEAVEGVEVGEGGGEGFFAVEKEAAGGVFDLFDLGCG